MKKISQKELKKIKAIVIKEFPKYFALQQVHIARKILSCEAKKAGLSIVEFVRRERAAEKIVHKK